MKNAAAEARLAELGAVAGTPLYLNHTRPGKGISEPEQVEYSSHEQVGSDLRIHVLAHRGEEAPTSITVLARNIKNIDAVHTRMPERPEVGSRAKLINTVDDKAHLKGSIVTVVRHQGTSTIVLPVDGEADRDELAVFWEHDLAPVPLTEQVPA